MYIQTFFLPKQRVLLHDFVKIILFTVIFLFPHRILPLNEMKSNVKHVVRAEYSIFKLSRFTSITSTLENGRPTLHDERAVTLYTVVSLTYGTITLSGNPLENTIYLS